MSPNNNKPGDKRGEQRGDNGDDKHRHNNMRSVDKHRHNNRHGVSAPLPPLRNQKPTWDKAADLARGWRLNKLAERLDALATA